MNNDQLIVKELLEAERIEEAMPFIIGMMEDNPDDPVALNFRGYIHLLLEDEATAYQFLKRSVDLSPNCGNITNLGKCLNEMGRHEEALKHFMQAAEYKPDYAPVYANASATLVQMSRWDDAQQCAEMALECDPDNIHAKLNLSHAQLAKGQWSEGFDNFEIGLGGKFRREWEYGDKGRWSGEKGTVVIYGEQGLGDEIYYAQALKDAGYRACLVLDCDKKLEGLFKRSFPYAEVHGTRREEHPEWIDSVDIDYRCAIGSLFHLFRHADSDFASNPWLVADPERRRMWRALFDSYQKPVIGIALKSGTRKNNAAGREIDIAEFYPLLNGIDAVFVSLEYKGDDPEELKSFPFATRSNDYDDTAAMIAELDAVVGICTTALHASDALGVPTWTLVPTKHNSRFTDAFPRMDNQHFVHQNGRSWTEVIGSIVSEVKHGIA
jgi:hypothetical protein